MHHILISRSGGAVEVGMGLPKQNPISGLGDATIDDGVVSSALCLFMGIVERFLGAKSFLRV